MVGMLSLAPFFPLWPQPQGPCPPQTLLGDLEPDLTERRDWAGSLLCLGCVYEPVSVSLCVWTGVCASAPGCVCAVCALGPHRHIQGADGLVP